MCGCLFLYKQTNYGQNMSKETKETVQYVSACVMLLFGMVLCIAGFIVPPTGEVDGSVLAILGQCLVFAGAVFGISIHYSNELKNFKAEVRDEIHENKNKNI